MSEQHTPTPCRLPKSALEEYLSEHQIVVDTDRGYPKVLFTGNGNIYEQAKIDARRIVACVNACEGIDTDFLERTHSKGHASGIAKHMRLEKERNELLAALIELRDWYTEVTGLPAVSANAAIANSKQD